MQSCSLRCFYNRQDVTKHIYSSTIWVFPINLALYLFILLKYIHMTAVVTLKINKTYDELEKCNIF